MLLAASLIDILGVSAAVPFSKKENKALPKLVADSQRKLQRRARRRATINVVDFSDVTTCQNMVDVSDRS